MWTKTTGRVDIAKRPTMRFWLLFLSLAFAFSAQVFAAPTPEEKALAELQVIHGNVSGISLDQIENARIKVNDIVDKFLKDNKNLADKGDLTKEEKEKLEAAEVEIKAKRDAILRGLDNRADIAERGRLQATKKLVETIIPEDLSNKLSEALNSGDTKAFNKVVKDIQKHVLGSGDALRNAIAARKTKEIEGFFNVLNTLLSSLEKIAQDLEDPNQFTSRREVADPLAVTVRAARDAILTMQRQIILAEPMANLPDKIIIFDVLAGAGHTAEEMEGYEDMSVLLEKLLRGASDDVTCLGNRPTSSSDVFDGFKEIEEYLLKQHEEGGLPGKVVVVGRLAAHGETDKNGNLKLLIAPAVGSTPEDSLSLPKLMQQADRLADKLAKPSKNGHPAVDVEFSFITESCRATEDPEAIKKANEQVTCVGKDKDGRITVLYSVRAGESLMRSLCVKRTDFAHLLIEARQQGLLRPKKPEESAADYIKEMARVYQDKINEHRSELEFFHSPDGRAIRHDFLDFLRDIFSDPTPEFTGPEVQTFPPGGVQKTEPPNAPPVPTKTTQTPPTGGAAFNTAIRRVVALGSNCGPIADITMPLQMGSGLNPLNTGDPLGDVFFNGALTPRGTPIPATFDGVPVTPNTISFLNNRRGIGLAGITGGNTGGDTGGGVVTPCPTISNEDTFLPIVDVFTTEGYLDAFFVPSIGGLAYNSATSPISNPNAAVRIFRPPGSLTFFITAGPRAVSVSPSTATAPFVGIPVSTIITATMTPISGFVTNTITVAYSVAITPFGPGSSILISLGATDPRCR